MFWCTRSTRVWKETSVSALQRLAACYFDRFDPQIFESVTEIRVNAVLAPETKRQILAYHLDLSWLKKVDSKIMYNYCYDNDCYER